MFDFLKKKTKPKEESIDLDLSKKECAKLLDLRKENFDAICLKKDIRIKSKVALALDFSGSMNALYRNGTVQSIIERIIPIALSFDDNEELDLWIFSNGFNRIGPVNKDNYYKITEKIINNYTMGGTNYLPVIRDIHKFYIEEEPSKTPAYVIFITDGDNSDKRDTADFLKISCTDNIFWQFIGIGYSPMRFLEKLDNLEKREKDNTNFFKIELIQAITDSVLYEKLMKEYPQWYKGK